MLQRSQMLDALLDTLNRIGRLILLDVAVGDACFFGSLDNGLHVDRAIAEFLECIVGDFPEFRERHAFLNILEVQLGNAAFQLFDKLHWIGSTDYYPEDVHFEFRFGNEAIRE